MTLKQRLLSIFVIATGFSLLVCSSASAQNSSAMFNRRDPRITNPYSDVVALRPGDLLVVLINEQSDVENKDQRRLNKSGSSNLVAGFNYGLSGGVGGSTGGASFDEQTEAERTFDGDAQFTSERGFTDRFTVTVIDVLPNGNLLISGSRRVGIEGDERTLTLTGVVRQFDISPRNTVVSQDISNLDVRYLSNGDPGSEKAFLNQSWLGRRINRWWPN